MPSPGEDPAPHAGTALRSVNAAAVRGRLYSNSRVRHLSVPAGECDWLVGIIPPAGKDVKPVEDQDGVQLIKELRFPSGGHTSGQSNRASVGPPGPCEAPSLQGCT